MLRPLGVAGGLALQKGVSPFAKQVPDGFRVQCSRRDCVDAHAEWGELRHEIAHQGFGQRFPRADRAVGGGDQAGSRG